MAAPSDQASSAPWAGGLRLSLLLRPMPAALLLPFAAAILILGAAYCSGYEALVSGRMDWPASLVWSAYAVLPWLLLFEHVKRREWEADCALPFAVVALLIAATAAGSIAAELVHKELVLGRDAPPLALQLMRRLPAMAAMALLLMLSRREQEIARRRPGAATGADADDADEADEADEAEALRRYAPGIRWIQAADNYLELHLAGQVRTRRVTMKQAAEILEPFGFVRVHRSVIVNRAHVARLVPQSGAPAVEMEGGARLPTGRAFGANLRRLR